MILNDITNDSATTGAESDIYRAKGKKKKEGIKRNTKMFNQCDRNRHNHLVLITINSSVQPLHERVV